jgi:hypothetical protein
MAWSIRDLFGTQRNPFRRSEENLVMLEQHLAGLEARYIVACDEAAASDKQALGVVGEIIERYRAYRKAKAEGRPGSLPDWNEAFLTEQLLNGLLPPDKAKSELATQLVALKVVDQAAHAELQREWDGLKNAEDADKRVGGILVSATRATQWKNTQRWIIRTLGTQYAVRLRNAFLCALVFGLILIVADAHFGPQMRTAALSGLGFAAAAGLLGASFSAMVNQGQLSELENIEEARAATSPQMIALRLGVGVAAALIVYFFFESGLVEGALFPDLQQIGFGKVTPLGNDLDPLRANAQALDQTTDELVRTLLAANERIASLLDAIPPPGPGVDMVKLENLSDLATPASLAVGDQSVLSDKLRLTGVELTNVREELVALRDQWSQSGRPLGALTPNPDLSKLVVWCFAAGFTQTLVPSMLAKITPKDAEA